jgi:anti-sigma B factor antagonist
VSEDVIDTLTGGPGEPTYHRDDLSVETREAAARRHRLEIHVDRVDGVLVIAPVGEIDMVTGGLLLEALIAAISTGESRLVVDLGQVPFMDSTALTIFLSAHRALAGMSGRLVLVAHDAQRDRFRLPWIGTLLGVRSTVIDAVRDLQTG